MRRRIRALLNASAATILVSSAACGADLIALSEARELGLGLRIILPFARDKFRISSVADRPGIGGQSTMKLWMMPKPRAPLQVLEKSLKKALIER